MYFHGAVLKFKAKLNQALDQFTNKRPYVTFWPVGVLVAEGVFPTNHDLSASWEIISSLQEDKRFR